MDERNIRAEAILILRESPEGLTRQEFIKKFEGEFPGVQEKSLLPIIDNLEKRAPSIVWRVGKKLIHNKYK